MRVRMLHCELKWEMSVKTERVTAKNLKEIIREHVDRESTIMTDEFLAYKGLNREFTDHQTVNHGTGEYVRGNAHTNTAEGYFSLLKRRIIGTYHHISLNMFHSTIRALE
jgi:transposase-like protein